MYVCICNAITDTQIRQAAESGVRDLWQLQRKLGVASNCGSCKEQASQILREHHKTSKRIQPTLHQPASV